MASKNSSGMRCVSCGQELPKTSFYTSHSSIYTGNNERLPVCSNCLQRQFQVYKDLYGSVEKGVQRTCMAFDLYFDKDAYDALAKKGEFTFADYIKRLYQRGSNKLNFDASVREGFLFLGNVETKMKEDEIKVPKRLIDFWGNNYRPEDYEVLQEHYEALTNDNPDRTSKQEIFIRDLCDLYVLKWHARIDNDIKSITDLTKTYRETFSQADLSVSRALDNTDSDTMGTLIEKIQNYSPAEYYKDKNLYADFDEYESYWKRFVLRPLKNLITGSVDRDPEYSVSEELEDG